MKSINAVLNAKLSGSHVCIPEKCMGGVVGSSSRGHFISMIYGVSCSCLASLPRE